MTMSYIEWKKAQESKVHTILSKLGYADIDNIVEYFNYDNMVEKEPDFCPLYKDKIKCHNIDNLNCYYCGCPYFIVNSKPIADNNNVMLESHCFINSKHRSSYITNPDADGIMHKHCDCTHCTIPHKAGYVKKMLLLIFNSNNNNNSSNSPFLQYLREYQLKSILQHKN